MKYIKAKKSKIIPIFDFQVKPIDQIKGNVEMIYFVVKILDSDIGEQAIHLHVDLNSSINRNIFTHEFCKKIYEKIPEIIEVYIGEDSRCKMKDISILEKIVYKLQEEND